MNLVDQLLEAINWRISKMYQLKGKYILPASIEPNEMIDAHLDYCRRVQADEDTIRYLYELRDLVQGAKKATESQDWEIPDEVGKEPYWDDINTLLNNKT